MSLWLKKARRELERNPNVEKTTEKHVSFKAAFKSQALKDHGKGISSTEIFRRAGFDISLFPENYCRETIKRWKKSFKKHGEDALTSDLRGSGASGRRRVRKASSEMGESELRARVAYLEAEVDFLKKLRALAKQGK